MERRNVLQMLTLAAGSAVLAGSAEASTQAPAPSDSRERVLGIGGFFFRALDPDALASWYEKHLGINLTPTAKGQQPWHTTAGVTSFSPFPQTTKYFGDMSKTWMINFRVHDIEKLAAQLEAEGIPVKVDPQTYPIGRFGRLHDPEGNTIELWQPA